MEVIEVRHPDTKKLMRFEMDFGESIDDAIVKFSKRSVFNRYLMGVRTSARNRIIRLKNKGLTEEQIQDKMKKWSPSTPEERRGMVAPKELREFVKRLTPEEKKFYRERVQSAN